MSIKVKKKTIKIVVGIIIAIALVIGGVFASQIISSNIKINQAQEKLSQINAKELETKIIKELESTELNVNTSTSKTEFRTLDSSKSNFDSYIAISYELTEKYENNGKPVERHFENFVSAFIIDKEDTNGVAIPCFKIESDSNGNFKNITYLEGGTTDKIETVVKNAVEKVFKNEYNVEIFISENDKYNLHFRNAGSILEPKVRNEEYWADINYEITSEKSSYIPDLTTITFGLDTK